MKNRGMGIKHPKSRGEWVELEFMQRAIELGLHLNKPWGEVMPYDFVVEDRGRFARVQVKSTMFVDRGGYSCTVRGCDGPYEGDPFEYLAAYVFQEDLWYIIPGELVVGQGSIALYPKLKCAKYGPYKEAWRLLRGRAPEAGYVDRIEACAELPRRTFGLVEWIRRGLGLTFSGRSFSDRSFSGRSFSGRSFSGRSFSGRSDAGETAPEAGI